MQGLCSPSMDCELATRNFSLVSACLLLRLARRRQMLTAVAHELRVLRRRCAPIFPARAHRNPAPPDFLRCRKRFARMGPLRTSWLLARGRRLSAMALLLPCLAAIAQASWRPFSVPAAPLAKRAK